MKIGDPIAVSGCITQEKFIAGRTLAEIEKLVGFQAGRLSDGIAVVALLELPGIAQFDLAAYSNVATHRQTAPLGLNIDKIKTNVRAIWRLTGPDRLVKVLSAKRHDSAVNPDVQYPPGRGIPQWLLKVPLPAKVCAIVDTYPNGRYLAADVVRR